MPLRRQHVLRGPAGYWQQLRPVHRLGTGGSHPENVPPLHQTEDTFIGGLSMGGYGALEKRPQVFLETFGSIVALSSALNVETALNLTNDAPIFMMRRDYMEACFGDLEAAQNSDVNPKWLIKQCKGAEETHSEYLRGQSATRTAFWASTRTLWRSCGRNMYRLPLRCAPAITSGISGIPTSKKRSTNGFPPRRTVWVSTVEMWGYDDPASHKKRRLPAVWNLRELYVDPFFQGTGVGSALINHFSDTARAGGMREGFLWVLEENHAGRAFYETHGYRYSGNEGPSRTPKKFLLRYNCFFL